MGRQESSGESTCLAISSPESVRKFVSVVSRSEYRSSNIGHVIAGWPFASFW